MTITFADTLPTVTANVRTFERAFESLSMTIERSSITVKQAVETISAATAALGEQLKAVSTTAEKPAEKTDSTGHDQPKPGKLDEVVTNIRNKVEDDFGTGFDAIFDSVGEALGDAVLGSKEKLRNLNETIRKDVGNLGKSVLKTIFGTLAKEAGKSLFDAIKAAGRTDDDPLRIRRPSGSGGGSGGGGSGGGVTEGLGNIVAGIDDGVSALLGGISKGLGEVTRGLGGALSTLGAGLSTALGGLVEGLGGILGSIFGSLGGSGGGGDILGSLLKIGASFLGPASGGAGASSAAQSTALSLSGPRFAFAHGGRPPVGVASLVGEEGPELFIPDSLGEIVPNNVLGGSGGGDIVVTYNIDARGAAPGMEQRIVQAIKLSENRAVLRAKFEIFESARRGGTFARMARV